MEECKWLCRYSRHRVRSTPPYEGHADPNLSSFSNLIECRIGEVSLYVHKRPRSYNIRFYIILSLRSKRDRQKGSLKNSPHVDGYSIPVELQRRAFPTTSCDIISTCHWMHSQLDSGAAHMSPLPSHVPYHLGAIVTIYCQGSI